MRTMQWIRWSGRPERGHRKVAGRAVRLLAVLMVGFVFVACGEDDQPTGPLGPGGGDAEGTWVMVAGNDTTYVRVTSSSVLVLERGDGDECYTLTPYALIAREGAVFTIEDLEQTVQAEWQMSRDGDQLVITDDSQESITLTRSNVEVAGLDVCPPPEQHTGVFPHDACTETTPLPLNGSVSGRLEPGDAQWSDDTYYDLYSLRITAPTTVTIAMNAAGGGFELDTYLAIYDDTAGVRLFRNDDVDYEGGNYNSRIQEEFDPGCYFVVANSYSDEAEEAGDYILTIETGGVVEPDFPHAACSATPPLAIDGTVAGRLEPTDSLWSDGSYYDVWSLQLEATQTVTLDLEARNPDVMDTYLMLYDDTGTERIEANDDVDSGAGNYNSRITTELGPGCYFVIANSYSNEPDEADDYFLTVTTGEPVTPDFENVLGCTNLPELPMGGMVTDSLAPGDMTWSDGTWVDLWSLKLNEETAVRITHEADDPVIMDTYLMLYNSAGTERVAENDDIDYDGGNYNSRIETTVGPACYVVVANSYSDEPGEEDGYTLSLDPL